MQIQGKLSHLKMLKKKKKKSLAVQWLRILTAGDTNSQIQFLLRELRSQNACQVVWQKKKKKKKFTLLYPFRVLFLCFLLSFSQDDLN